MRIQARWVSRMYRYETHSEQDCRSLAEAHCDSEANELASVGVVNVAVDVTVFAVAYKLLQLPLILSNVIAWAIAVSGSYVMNTKITFGRETGGAFRLSHYLTFAASGILGVIIATTTLFLSSLYTNILVAKLLSIVALWRKFFLCRIL